jgi:hypothetical protein
MGRIRRDATLIDLILKQRPCETERLRQTQDAKARSEILVPDAWPSR